MRKHHYQLALVLGSLAATVLSTPGIAYARKSLMEYGGRVAPNSFYGGQNPYSNQQGWTGGQFFGNGRSGRGHGSNCGFSLGRLPGAGGEYILITMRSGTNCKAICWRSLPGQAVLTCGRSCRIAPAITWSASTPRARRQQQRSHQPDRQH